MELILFLSNLYSYVCNAPSLWIMFIYSCLLSPIMDGGSHFYLMLLVKIQYAKTENSSITFHFTIIAYTGSLKKQQAQHKHKRHKFILGNPHGVENPVKLPQYRWPAIYKDETLRHDLLLHNSRPLLHKWVILKWVCVYNEEHTSSIYTQLRLVFYTSYVGTKLTTLHNVIGPTPLGWSNNPLTHIRHTGLTPTREV